MPYLHYIGIDVSKQSLDVCVINPDEQILFSSSFSNAYIGITKLISMITTKWPNSYVVLESTGDYHLLPAVLIAKSGITVSVINPIISKAYSSISVRKVKTDKQDAHLLATIAVRETDLAIFSGDLDVIEKRKLTSFVSTCEKHLTDLKKAHKQIVKSFDGLSIEFVANNQMEAAIKALELVIQELNKSICNKVSNKTVVDSIAHTSGITKHTAAKLISLIEHIEFKNTKSAVAYAGLDVSVKQSGRYVGKAKLTKRGKPEIRKYAYQMAWGVSTHHPFFKKLTAYYRSQGRHYYAILNIIARKLIKIIHKLITTGESFDESKLSFKTF